MFPYAERKSTLLQARVMHSSLGRDTTVFALAPPGYFSRRIAQPPHHDDTFWRRFFDIIRWRAPAEQ